MKLLIGGTMMYTAFIIGRYWFNLIPLDPDYADMLPVIRSMNERFVHGNWKEVYDPIQEIWQGVKPVYLPAMWAPYSIPLLLHMDIRWLSVFSLLLSFSIFLWVLRFRNQGLYPALLLGIAGMLFWWLFAADDRHGLLSLSEEGLIILYYVLLTAAIVSGNIYLIGLAVCFCMLSRYALIGWIPAFVVWLCWKQQFRRDRHFYPDRYGRVPVVFSFAIRLWCFSNGYCNCPGIISPLPAAFGMIVPKYSG